ncbi:MAG: hypothetical protein N3I86_09140 [Verrucomicrobiae bacterium]|nr:hypothetical protein [Verrucomicrobiae bacterium]
MKKLIALTTTLAAWLTLSAHAQPTTLYWDPTFTGSTNGGGAGTWNFSALQWFNGTANVVWTNDGSCRAVFGGTNGGQVQVASGLIIEAHSLEVNTPGYFFTGGGTRRMTVHSGIIQANADFAINMIITNPPSATNLVGIIKTGPGRLRFGVGNNTFQGGLTVLEGTVVITNKQQIGAEGGPLIVNGGTVELGDSDTVSGRILYIGDNGATFYVQYDTNTWIWQLPRATNGAIVKLGPGAIRFGFAGGTMTNVSGGTGPVTIHEGSLFAQTSVGSSIGTGPVFVNTNGTLAGPGLVGGHVTVKGRLSPSIGGTGANNLRNMTLANGLTMNDGGTYLWDLLALVDDATGQAGIDYDRVTVTNGNLTLGGTSKLSIRFGGTASDPDSGNPFWTNSHTWTVILVTNTAANPGGSNFALLENAVYTAGSFSTSVAPDGSIRLHYTPGGAPPPVPPHIQTIINQGRTNVLLTWSSEAGRTYQVQFNTNIATTNWTALTNIVATGALTTVADTAAAAPARFYRVVVLP